MSTEDAEEAVAKCIQSDGGLFNLGWYLSYKPGNDEAVLDGRFTADELVAIAAYMRLVSEQR
jgi:hypothetical protein